MRCSGNICLTSLWKLYLRQAGHLNLGKLIVSLAYIVLELVTTSQNLAQVQEIVAIANNATRKSELLIENNYIRPVNDKFCRIVILVF